MPEADRNQLTIAIDLKKNRIRIHKSTLRLLGSPPFIKLLLSPKHRAIAVLKCEKQVPRGQEIIVSFDKPDSSGTFLIYSKDLMTLIRSEFPGLEKDGLYRLTGRSVPEEGGVWFPLEPLARPEEKDV